MWRALDETCCRGVAEGAFPGAVVLVGDGRKILLHRAYGHRALTPERLPMTPDTVFDLSSLTKPMATTTAMMLLARDGRVRLDDPACTVIPEFSDGDRATVTFRQLLNHTSGLPAWKPYYESVIPADNRNPPPLPGAHGLRPVPNPTPLPGAHGLRPVPNPTPLPLGEGGRRPGEGSPATLHDLPHPDPLPEGEGDRFRATVENPDPSPAGAGSRTHAAAEAAVRKRRFFARVHAEQLLAPPGTKHLYSDLGFILLGEVVERLSGMPLDRFCQDEIFAPMGLDSTFFVDLSRFAPEPRPGAVVAATEDCPWRGRILCGEVHDDNAHAMGGVAGHAGVFSSAPDIHRFIRFLGRCLDGAEPDFLPAAVVREFLETEGLLPGQTHVLGWDTPSPAGSSSGRHFSARTVGHLGFTGTSIWWDLERELHVVFLTNRVHPFRDNPAIREYRPLVHDAVMEGFFS